MEHMIFLLLVLFLALMQHELPITRKNVREYKIWQEKIGSNISNRFIGLVTPIGELCMSFSKLML